MADTDLARTAEHLTEPPGMGGAFTRALIPRRGDTARIPARAVTIHGHRQDLARLADYSRVCGFTLRDSVPATWIHVLTFPLHVHLLSDAESSVRLVGAVHVSNDMTMHRTVGSDEVLDLTVHLENLRPHRRGALVDLVGQAHVDGELVWDGVSTYLSSSVSVPGDPVERDRTPFEARTPQGLWRLPADLGRHYRRVSKDPNPIHTNRLAAKAFGFPRPIIHGMWTHARALAALEGRLPVSYTAHVDFVKPILLPGTVGFTSTATAHGQDLAVTSRDGAKPFLLMSVTDGAP
ncbi:MaoC/PaaZ C-terminal domain-containing protein [Demequina muriae]|uniref:MaoC/PaaZ C-terminal domain-containing protein n=1 Tax=Demequina muriae TaxID=3051664 RepID=A0ABT8GK60_9MICO|nr:MaoC/PaaZ C-terminal domain-containing protein [Demequina sp. EGI L300058]MDN4481805.1 MaoC/PaaZ C-terminal domain-containing protein [Demequina sp. EGI L300058]